MIKKYFFSLMLTLSLSSYSANTIIAVLNDDIITLNQLQKIVNQDDSKNQKIEIIESLISEKIELEYIKKLKIIPTNNAINTELNNIAQHNNISIDDLKKLKNFEEIFSLLVTNLSKIGLRQIIIQQETKKTISPSSAEGIAIYQEWLKKIKSQMFIEIYENKL